MSDNVTPLPGARIDIRPQDPGPQAGVVTFLEDLLARARAGNVQAIAVTFVTPSGRCCDAWQQNDAGTSYNDLAAGLLYLTQRYAAGINENDVLDTWTPPKP